MGFPFVHVCDLLDELSQLHTETSNLSTKQLQSTASNIVHHWFHRHRESIRRADGVALLSALLPDLRTDKVYCIQEQALEKIIAKSDGMGSGRREDLSNWKQPGKGDLGDCVERVLRLTDGGRVNCHVTVEDIEHATLAVASKRRFSSPAVRSFPRENSLSDKANQEFIDLYQRSKSREAKWLTRLILKRYSPISIPQFSVYRGYHPLLSRVLKFQDHFTYAAKVLKKLETIGGSDVLEHLCPQIGVKVGRQKFFQGRSIHHCMQMGGDRQMIVERKYDGEYAQVHIDLTRPRHQWIQIFSKSGKDSTMDRKNVHDTITACLNLGKPSCRISRMCILEGELLVYSDKDQEILPFHKIRKHVSRSGSFLGTEQDSQPHPYEHLCMMFFDILLLDDLALVKQKHSMRQKHLISILEIIPGRADIVQRETIDFASPKAKKYLRRLFARSISRGEEGLVLKPDEPYIDLTGDYRRYKSCCIKLKKDAVGDFEIGLFAVVGANYNNSEAMRSEFVDLYPRIKWNEFFLACLENREDVLRAQAKPEFTIVATVTLNAAMLRDLISHESLGFSCDSDEPQPFDIKMPKGISNGRPPSTIFSKPFVFDIKCFQFDKKGNTGFESPRFPLVTKLHYDKDFMDCITFEDLQEKAAEARAIPHDLEDSQKEREWVNTIKKADPKKIRALSQDSVDPTQSTVDRSTQGTTQRTERTVSSVVSDAAQRPEVFHQTIQTTSRLIAVESKSVTSEVAAPRLNSVQTEHFTPQQTERKSTSIKSRAQSLRPRRVAVRRSSPPIIFRENSDLVDPQDPPTQFLESSFLIEAAMEQDDGILDSVALGCTENVETNPANHINCKKRYINDIEKSPEHPAKIPKLLKQRSSARHGVISPPRRPLSNITKPLNRMVQQEPSSSSRANGAVAPTSIPYPTPPKEITKTGDLPHSANSNTGRVLCGDFISQKPSQSSVATPPRSSGLLTSDGNNSSSPLRRVFETPPSSSPSNTATLQTGSPTNEALQLTPLIVLPHPSSLCMSTPTCHFGRYSFYFPPSLASTEPSIAQDPLPAHKRPFTTSLTHWSDPVLFPTYSPPTHFLFPKIRMLRCVLVEFRNKLETKEVIWEVERWVEKNETSLNRSNGEREPIVVVDWRILGKVKRMEADGQEVEGRYDIWKRFSAYGRGYI